MTEGAGLREPGSPEFLAALAEDDPHELYDNAPCAYLSTLADGTIIKANQTFFTWTGYDRSDLVGRRRFQDLFAVGDRIFFETHYAPLLRMQGSVREVALELTLRDGSTLPVLANSVAKLDAGGRPQVVRTVLFDARERRSYERELLGARRRAEAAEARARELAETLQSTFLPPTAITVPGLDVAGVYRPAGDGSEVGGDFYDVFRTARGTYTIVLGDVSGKGVGAAVVTALARHVVHAETLSTSSPSAVLRVVHETLAMAHPDHLCTAVLLEVAVEGGVRLTMGCAGHPRPIRTDGTTTVRVGSTGTLLGMVDTFSVHDTEVDLLPGESLVLYTDGISEARSAQGFFGDDRVEEVVAAHASETAAGLAGALADAALDFQGGWARDDIAVVVVRRPA